MPITLNLLPEAEAYLRKQVGKRKYGHGVIVSALLLAKKEREEASKACEEPQSTRESWRQSGLNVD